MGQQEQNGEVHHHLRNSVDPSVREPTLEKNLSPLETRDFLAAQALEANPRSAFGFDGGTSPVTATFGWHTHSHHQLLYASAGAIVVDGSRRRYLLAPLRAALITAGTRHRTVVAGDGQPTASLNVFFAPGFVEALDRPGIHVIGSSPVQRELIMLAARWGPRHSPSSLSESCFRTLALLCADRLANPDPFWLPRTDHRELSKALVFVEQNLAAATEACAAEAAGMSERNFRRQFAASLGMGWREYLLRARLLKAADLIGSTNQSLEEIAWTCGYRSSSAFNHAFRAFAGAPPGAYRRRAVPASD